MATNTPTAVLPGEKVQMRLVGSAPIVVAESRQLSFVLDPAGVAPGNASFTVRHGPSPMLSVADSGDGGVDLSAGSVADGGPSNQQQVPVYMSFRTPNRGTPSQVERLRLSEAALDVSVNGTFAGDLSVYGQLNVGSYVNLVDSYASASILQPPTANALACAYRSLSNMVVTYTNTSSQSTSSVSGAVLPDGFDPAAADAMVTGSLLCTNLYVSPNGSLVASSFCNLAQDYEATSLTVPPSANALNAAYLHLSNMVVNKIRSAANSLVRSNVTYQVATNSLQADSWIVSEPDKANRILFPSAPNVPAVFAAGPGNLPGGLAFAWRAAGSNLMTLARGGALAVSGGIDVASGGIRVGGGGLQSAGGISVSLGDITLDSGGVVLQAGGVDVRAGCVSAVGYCNLPVATLTAPGIVQLTDVGGAAYSNAAATGAALAASVDSASRRTDMLQSYVSDALYALYVTSNAAATASNLSCARTWVRAFDEPDVVNAVALTNASTSTGAGVRMLFGVGVGGSPSDLRSNAAASPAYVADASGSNCASISIVAGPSSLGAGSKELVIAGAPPLQALPGVPPPCEVAVGASVQIRAGRAATMLPSINATSASFSDSAIGAHFEISASSTYAPDDFWDQPYVVATDGTLAWISAADTYVSGTGYPSLAASQTHYVQLDGGGVNSVMGEWVQIDVSPGAFVARFVLAASDSWVPDDFVLLGSTDASGTSPWTLVASQTAQGAALSAAGTSGVQYRVEAADQAETRMGAFRLVVTRILVTSPAMDQNQQLGLVKVEKFRLYGSTVYPLPTTLLAVDTCTLVVDRSGHVGINQCEPSAPLHIGGLDQVVRLAPSTTAPVPAVILLDGTAAGQFRGVGLSSNAMVLSAEADSDHALVSGTTQLARFHGKDASLSNAGCGSFGASFAIGSNAVVGGRLSVDGPVTMSNSTTTYGPTWLCDSVVISSPSAPSLAASAYPLTVQSASPAQGLDPISIYATGAVYSGGDVYSYSDRRVKGDVSRIEGALDRLMAIGGYTYSRLDLDGVRGTGVIAQEVERVLPEAVRRDVDGNLHVAYGNLVGLLIEAVRELANRPAKT